MLLVVCIKIQGKISNKNCSSIWWYIYILQIHVYHLVWLKHLFVIILLQNTIVFSENLYDLLKDSAVHIWQQNNNEPVLYTDISCTISMLVHSLSICLYAWTESFCATQSTVSPADTYIQSTYNFQIINFEANLISKYTVYSGRDESETWRGHSIAIAQVFVSIFLLGQLVMVI